jgi:hypothetical protein
MAARRTKAEKALDDAYDNAFKTRANGVQFNMMDLGNVRRETMDGMKAGKSMEEAIDAAIAKYRKN